MAHKFKVLVFAASMLVGAAQARAGIEAECCSFDRNTDIGSNCTLLSPSGLPIIGAPSCGGGFFIIDCGPQEALNCGSRAVALRAAGPIAIGPGGTGLECQCVTVPANSAYNPLP